MVVAFGKLTRKPPLVRRESRHQRGYDTDWDKFRAWFLKRHPLCEDHDRPHPANEVHHIEKIKHRPDLRLVESNCMALCKACHQVRTARGE